MQIRQRKQYKPAYLKISERELNARINKLFKLFESCELCPRKCKINRLKGELGFCKVAELPMLYSYHPHFGEESVLVGSYGSGTIFFSSCNLACVYCQNYEISHLRLGREVSFDELAEIMLELQNMGCHNINLVTPTHQLPQIIKSLQIAIKNGLSIPLVYNTNAYDSVKTLKLLDGIIDIYMPDAKYSDDKALKYSNAPNYFSIMKAAIKEMHRQVGDLVIENGIAVRGLLVRHLVLPNSIAGSEKIFNFLARLSQNTFINIMAQYRPCYRAKNFPELNRRITEKEYMEAIRLAKKAGLKRIYT